MRTAAQPDTRALSLLVCLAFAGCTKAAVIPGADDGAVDQAGSSASCAPVPCPPAAPWDPSRCACAPLDAGAASAECRSNTDCALALVVCCGVCLPPTREQVSAVPKSGLADAMRKACPNPTTCGECYIEDPEPLAPLFAAGCVANRCELVDLRADELSRCDTDSDCIAVSRGCCPASSEDPSEYVGIHRDADAALLACSPVPPCIAPTPHAVPVAFCAADGHCAVRRRETSKGVASSACYSPTQNLEHAYDPAAIGCDCAPLSRALCRRDVTGRDVALECVDDAHWQAVEDGPCSL